MRSAARASVRRPECESQPTAAIAATVATGEAMARALPSTHGEPTMTVAAQLTAVPAT